MDRLQILKEELEELDSYKKIIFDFSGTEFRPFRKEMTTLKDGYYLTIKCGYSGISTEVNEWKNGKWCKRSLDGSDIIAYSKEELNLTFIKNESKDNNDN